MSNKIVSRFVRAADLLGPRTFFRTLGRVDQLMEETRELRAVVEALHLRTEQLVAIEQLNWEQQDALKALDTQLDAAAITAHIHRAVHEAQLRDEPFPHVVVDNWLPPAIYDLMIEALPPAVFFTEREMARQRLLVPFSFAPAYSRRVWQFVAKEIVGCALGEALRQKFERPLREYASAVCDGWPAELEGPLHASNGRIMLRRPGYVIKPHRDPKWGFITGLVYLVREGDGEGHGTQLYRVRDDGDAPNDKPYYVDEERCELVSTVPFRANSMLAFLNSRGAHGASIPADAQPPDLERYVYQFRLGPERRAIKRLLSVMPGDTRTSWVSEKGRGDY